MAPESHSQKTHGVDIDPKSFGEMAPGGNNTLAPLPPLLKVTNNDGFTRYYHVDFLLKGEESDWFDKIKDYSLKPNGSDPQPKPIHVQVPENFAQALAGKYNVVIEVKQLDTGEPPVSETVELIVLREGDYSVSVKPGEMNDNTALFRLSIENNANAPLQFRLKDVLSSAPCTFSANPPDMMKVKPTETQPLDVTVRLKDNQSLPAGHTIVLVTEGKYLLEGDGTEEPTEEPASEKTQKVTWPRPPLSVAPLSLSPVPGEKAELTLTLTNEGRDTQQISLSVEGIPEGWVNQTTPSLLNLLPGSSATANLAISVPKDALAGDYSPFRVRAASRNAQAQAEVPMAVQLSDKVKITPQGPDQAENYQEAHFQVTIHNASNAPIQVSLSDSHRADHLTFELTPISVKPNETQEARLTVRLNGAVTTTRKDSFKLTLRIEFRLEGGAKPFSRDDSVSGEVTWHTKVQPTVTVYEDSHYQGTSAALEVGEYDLKDLKKIGIGNDTLSSLRVPRGMRATLYMDKNFQGEKMVFDEDAEYVGDNFNDETSSIVIDHVVWVYKDWNFQGASAALGIGRYDLDDLRKLGIRDNTDNTLSSLQVPRGMRATLYIGPDFKGNRMVFDEDAEYVGHDFKDKTSSIVIDQP